MGSAQFCFFCHRNRHFIISLLMLLISSLTHARFMAEGRSINKLLEKGAEEKMGVAVVKAQTIGSRPPSCERRCTSCGHCEAVQVPVTTKTQVYKRSNSHVSATISNIAYSRGDDISNYKPISWKCKCGNLLLNP